MVVSDVNLGSFPTQFPILITQFPILIIQFSILITQFPILITQFRILITQFPILITLIRAHLTPLRNTHYNILYLYNYRNDINVLKTLFHLYQSQQFVSMYYISI